MVLDSIKHGNIFSFGQDCSVIGPHQRASSLDQQRGPLDRHGKGRGAARVVGWVNAWRSWGFRSCEGEQGFVANAQGNTEELVG